MIPLILLQTSIAGAPWSLICSIIALVLFALAALNVPSSRVSLGWAGSFFFALAVALR